MDQRGLRDILNDVQSGEIRVDEALERLAWLPFENLTHSRVDLHRAIRTGFPEVIFGSGKTPEQVISIMQSILSRSPRAMTTRVDQDAVEAILQTMPDARHHSRARMIIVDRQPLERVPGVAVVTAGTSDEPVAEEAALTAETLGNGVERFYDVGVAGLHRLMDVLPRLRAARAVVVVAGMEGALPSVVGGLVAVPVIAVPTNVGYGASFGGLAALLGMLNSCATGVSVVNIDNGFSAGAIAAMINRRGE